MSVIGIDLGTTNSCVAIHKNGETTIIPSAEGGRTTPSVVAFSEGERLIGQVARRQAVVNPDNTLFGIKRLIGKKFSSPEIQKDKEVLPFDLVEAENGDVHIKLGIKKYSPPEISAMVLQRLKKSAEDFLGHPVTKAVITVPAYFDDSQRQATKDAGHIAGLEVERIINEPTAAALAYGISGKEGIIAVYDLGGGTFDISILEIGDGVFEVKSTNGHTHLGGDDFDMRLTNYLVDEFRKDTGIDLRDDKMALQRLKEAAEKAKMELSFAPETEVQLPFISANASGPQHLNLKLTRSKFESLITDLVEMTVPCCETALKDAGVTKDQITEVILVGGMTRMPLVQSKVKEVFEREPSKGVNPDEVVAIGAALQAAIIGGDVDGVVLLDVTPLSLGIETLGGVFTRMINKNTTIPTRKSETYSTAQDNQPSVTIHVLQGERPMARDNKTLGRFELMDIPPSPRGVPQIEVTFDIDVNGIVQVSAKDKGTGKEQTIKITASSGLTPEEISSMIKDAEDHAEDDAKRREMVELRNRAENITYMIEKMMSEHSDKLEEDLKKELEDKIMEVRRVVGTEVKEDIEKALDDLNKTSHKLSEKIYAPPPGAEGPPAGGPKAYDQHGNEVPIDVQFKDVGTEE